MPIRNSQSEIRNLIMQPEISRRCNSCGASTPEGAMFCPECGQALTAEPQASNAQAAEDSKPPAAVSGPLAPDTSNEAKQANSAQAAPSTTQVEQPAAPVERVSADPFEPETKAESQTVSSANPTRVERTREKLQHASSVARGAIEQNVKRADKIRHVSSAMLEEASYDPSLRFVLVALGLFIVFLVLLLLSKVMG